jgi:uncharacterized protein YbcI
MASTTEERFAGGSLMAAISNAVVRITAEYTGRGPTQARASLRDDLVVVLMKDTLTKGERSLQTAGDGDLVIQTRVVGYQKAMQEALIASIENLTERKVIAFMSANHVDPDMGAEMFVLEPAVTHLNDALPSAAKSDRGAHQQFDRDHALPRPR